MDADLPPDLLEPTLTEADDAVGFDRPWNPYHLLLITFFAGLPTGGALLVLNYPRLGLASRMGRGVAVVGLGTLGLIGALAAVRVLAEPEALRDSRQLVRFGQQALSLLLAGILVLDQRRRFDLFERTGQETGKLLLPAIAAIGAGLVVGVGLVMAAVAVAAVVSGQRREGERSDGPDRASSRAGRRGGVRAGAALARRRAPRARRGDAAAGARAGARGP